MDVLLAITRPLICSVQIIIIIVLLNNGPWEFNFYVNNWRHLGLSIIESLYSIYIGNISKFIMISSWQLLGKKHSELNFKVMAFTENTLLKILFPVFLKVQKRWISCHPDPFYYFNPITDIIPDQFWSRFWRGGIWRIWKLLDGFVTFLDPFTSLKILRLVTTVIILVCY